MEHIKELSLLDENYITDIVNLRYLMQFEEEDTDIQYLEENKEILLKNIRNYIVKHLNRDLFVMAYIVDNKVVSVTSFIIHQYIPNIQYLNGIKGTVSFVYTDKLYRQRGFQKQLLKMSFDKARELGISVLKLNTNNSVAARMYESFGFVKSENAYKCKL